MKAASSIRSSLRGSRSALPGLGLTLGYTLLYLGVVVLVPLAALVLRAADLSWSQYWATVTTPRALASYRLTLGASLTAAGLNGVFGLLVAWVLVRYRFPGRRLVDAIVDLPFALPTAVAGIALTAVYAPNGWIGSFLHSWGVPIAYTPAGVVVALTFVGLPFVVRTVQPVLEDLDPEVEEAARSLGATPFQTTARIIIPTVLPALATGTALAFARALGEYGSIVFISGNLPMRTEMTTVLIMARLEQFDYAGATALASVMLGMSFALLLGINLMQWMVRRRMA
ncbi:MAG: sulfate ABC transporter permease subunit CysT [Acidobacteria bacterium]|nr:sulfate ABC transporter permease subunit CysT [Acidobacteriota bacterium]